MKRIRFGKLAGQLIIIGGIALLLAPPVSCIYSGFKQESVRTNYATVRGDTRSLQTALETYRFDHGGFPAMRPLRVFTTKHHALRKMGGWDLSTIELGRAGLAGLTTPIAYGFTFADPFAARIRDLPYAYYTDGNGWILISPGPDGIYDITDPAKVYDSTIPQPSDFLIGGPWTWDPTNGATSRGDIWRVRQ